MAFDFDGAEAAGLSQEAILKELEKSGKVGYDFTGARKAGISTNEIYSTIKTKMSQPTDLPALPEELPDVVPGPPEEYDNGLVGETSVGEITVLPETNTIPENQQLDLQTTAPSQPMVGERGQLTTTTDLPMSMEEEATRRATGPTGMQAAQASGLPQPAEGVAYRDPKTGEVVSTTTQVGSAEPAYDILFGPAGKLGAFGVLSGPAGVEAGKVVGKKATEVAQAIDDMFKAHPAAGLGDALSKEAKYILNRNPNITEEQVVQALQGVKTADQAYALSRMLGETGYIRQAVRADGDTAAGALRADLEIARDKILQTVGTVDVAQAKAKYSDMVQAIAGDYQNVHNATPILEDLNFLERFYGVTPSAGNRVVTQMKATLGENPNINLSDALEFRADLNHLISKATRGKEKVKLNSIKENLDGFINSVATPKQKSMIDEAIGTYSRTMQNRDVLDLVERNTKDGIAVNWTKLHRDLNDANLRSPEAVDALRIAEAFSKRFGNDKKLLNIAMPQGSSPDSGGVLGAWGYVINHLKDTLAIYGNRAENLKIQKAILKSIKSGTTNLDFVNKLKANTDVPDEVSKIFEDLLQIPYKAGARQTGDVNLEPIITPVGGTEKVVPKATEEVPELNDSYIQQELNKLESIIPTDSYVKPEDFSKYKTPISKEDEAYLISRQGMGYLNDAKSYRFTEEETSLLKDIHNVYSTPGVDAEKAYENILKKYRGSRVLDEILEGEGPPETFGAFSGMADELLSSGYSQSRGNLAHERASIVLDKDLYVTKSNLDTMEDSNGLVSTFAVSPKQLIAFNPNDKNAKVFRVPKGTKVTFADRGQVPVEGIPGKAEELVIDSKVLREIPSAKISSMNRVKDQVIKRYTMLKLIQEGMDPTAARAKVYKGKFRFPEADYLKLFSTIPVAVGLSKAKQNEENGD